ncbi:MAG: class II aldolase/adducin family protein, partial [Caldiserica bacterium]|nr:class II aldolase/adducin family protein [Caldisericota bacterium]
METATKLVEIAKRLYDRNMNAALGGNVSFRHGDEITITEAGINKGFMNADDVVVVDMDGNKLLGNGKPSSEGKMHYEIYKLRPDVHAVIHAHPPFAVAFALAHHDLPDDILPEAAVLLGRVPCLPYVTPSTIELAREVAQGLAHRNAAFMANHGVITVGADLEEAYNRMELLEQTCMSVVYATMLGGVHHIPPADMEFFVD